MAEYHRPRRHWLLQEFLQKMTTTLMFSAAMSVLLLVEPQLSTPKASPPQYGAVAVRSAPQTTPFLGCETSPTRLRCFSNLRALISEAYLIRYDFIVQGPKWIDDQIWALQATVNPDDVEQVSTLSSDQRSAMIKAILADRFGLKVHQETRSQAVYDLIIAKGGHKLQASAPASEAGNKDLPTDLPQSDFFTISDGIARGAGETMSEITKQLSGAFGSDQIDRPIVDKTGLTGRWNFTIKDDMKGEHAPSPFTVLEEQLGLKLVPAREPLPVLVINEAHPSTPN